MRYVAQNSQKNNEKKVQTAQPENFLAHLSQNLSSAKLALGVQNSDTQIQQGARQRRMMSSDYAVISERQIKKAEELQRQALILYKRKDYFDALIIFQKAVQVFQVPKLTPELKKLHPEAYNLIKECYISSSSCYLRNSQFEPAIEMMNSVLVVEPDNVDALYLRGQGFYLTG